MIVTVTSVDEARQAASADALCLQGSEAGGHRGSFTNTADEPLPLRVLLHSVRAMTSQPLIAAGGLCGALGVALSAAAAHAGGDNLDTAASFLLMHAPAFLAIGLLQGGRLQRAGGLILLSGLLIFAGDLLARHYIGARLFPMAAPIGGSLMILGWLLVALSPFVGRPGER